MIFVCSSTLNKDIHIIVIKLPENLDQSRPKARGLVVFPSLFLLFSFFLSTPVFFYFSLFFRFSFLVTKTTSFFGRVIRRVIRLQRGSIAHRPLMFGNKRAIRR